MELPTSKELLEAGVHYGHMKKKWNPHMRPYIFMEKKGIHIIDLNATQKALEKAGAAMKQIVKSGKTVLFVATKRQASDIVATAAESVGMPYVTDRWLGGMLTNFSTVRRSVRKMKTIDRKLSDGMVTNITKKERLTMTRERDKIEKTLGGISKLRKIPDALFIVDISYEHLAVDEAQKLGITTFGMVDTNSDPAQVDFAIPANDDAARSIKVILDYIVECIRQGKAERQNVKEDETVKE